jgi:CBS domain containing-hemolysin-like protein
MPRTARISLFGLCTAVFPGAAFASFLPPEVMDTAADWIALFVLFVVPIGAIVLFWLVHILPEKIAENRHHPQKQAINTLCLLSLAFGGLLWPIAWLWAYSRPVAFRIAYGTDKHEDYFREMVHEARAGKLTREDVMRLRGELDDIESRRILSPELKQVRDELAVILASAAQQDGKVP